MNKQLLEMPVRGCHLLLLDVDHSGTEACCSRFNAEKEEEDSYIVREEVTAGEPSR